MSTDRFHNTCEKEGDITHFVRHNYVLELSKIAVFMITKVASAVCFVALFLIHFGHLISKFFGTCLKKVPLWGWYMLCFCFQQSFGIRTAGLEEKATACQMLVCYARELKEAFSEYSEEVVKIMVPLLKFYFHDDILLCKNVMKWMKGVVSLFHRL